MDKEIEEDAETDLDENVDKEPEIKKKRYELVLDMSKMEKVYEIHKELFERLKHL